MAYELRIRSAAKKQMQRLPDNIFRLVDQHIRALRGDPRPPGAKKLVGGIGWRIRVGDYRVIYEIDDQLTIVSVVAVKPRQSAYK